MSVIDEINIAIAADIPALLWGAPGTGKTSAIQALARKAGAHMETLIGSTIDPTDLARPVINDKYEVKLVAAPWANRLRNAIDSGKPAWLFMDELSCVPPSVQAALLRVVQERIVGEIDLAGVKIIAAANPQDQAAGGWDLAPASSNRWLHLDWQINSDEWAAGELVGWGAGDISESRAEMAALIVSWIRHRPTTLVDCPESANGRAWPSPRSWSNLIRGLSFLPGSPRDKVLAKSGKILACGLVGAGAAQELSSWVADQDLPNPKDVLDGKVGLPERADRQRATVEAIIAYALYHNIDSGNVWKAISLARKDVRLALGMLYLNAAEKAGKEVSTDAAFDEIISLMRKSSSVRAKASVIYQRQT